VSHEKAKQALLRSLRKARRAILCEAGTLPPAKQNVVFLGSWSARHLLAHLIGWDHTNAQATAEIRRHKVPSFFRHYDRDWATYNASLVRRHNRGSFENLLAAAANSSDELLGFLERIPACEFYRDTGPRSRGWKVTIGGLLAVEAKDEAVHASQLRRFRMGAAKRRKSGQSC